MRIDFETGVRTFEPGDDAEYESWLRGHAGYVLSQRRDRSFMLHYADCRHLDLKTKNWSGWITDRPRRWAQAVGPLVEWAEGRGSKPDSCSTCM